MKSKYKQKSKTWVVSPKQGRDTGGDSKKQNPKARQRSETTGNKKTKKNRINRMSHSDNRQSRPELEVGMGREQTESGKTN